MLQHVSFWRPYQAMINTLRGGICSHNKGVFSDIWWQFNLEDFLLINLLIWKLSRQKFHLQQQFPVPAPSHCLEEFWQYAGLFLCLYGSGLTCLHIAGSELSDAANTAFFHFQSNFRGLWPTGGLLWLQIKTFPNGLRPADKWIPLECNTHTHTHTIPQSWLIYLQKNDMCFFFLCTHSFISLGLHGSWFFWGFLLARFALFVCSHGRFMSLCGCLSP